MKMLAASILIILTLSATLAFPVAPFESCSCSAYDDTCQASVTCRGGCIAWCPTDGCVAACLDDGGGSSPDEGGTLRSVSVRFKGSDSREVSAELARLTGKEVAFSPSTPGATINLEVENLPVWDLLELLSQNGRIRIAGLDLYTIKTVRRALLYGEPISVCAHGMTVKRFVNELRFMTGLNIQFTGGNPNTIVSYTGKGVRLNDIMSQVSERTGVQITLK